MNNVLIELKFKISKEVAVGHHTGIGHFVGLLRFDESPIGKNMGKTLAANLPIKST